jgi:superfamily II DNA helicase RecQ
VAAQNGSLLDAHRQRQRVVSIEKYFVPDSSSSMWAVCVSYVDGPREFTPKKGGGRVDYREGLNDADFAIFAKLRTLRKTLSDHEGVPAYALFTNEQLAEMVRRQVSSVTAMQQIEGVGPARVEK